eukprot:1182973-Prorocentrum_minimum.AAC.2
MPPPEATEYLSFKYPAEKTTVQEEPTPSKGNPTPGRPTPGRWSSHDHTNMECLDVNNALFWLNHQLADTSLSVATLKDLDDGHVLLALVDKLLGLGGSLQRKAHLTAANNKYKKIDNMSIVLNAMKSATGIPVPMSSLDLVTSLEKGEYSEILATIWRLVLQYDGEASRDPLGWAERMRRLEQSQKNAAEAARTRMERLEREEREQRESRKLIALQMKEEKERAEQRKAGDIPGPTVEEPQESVPEPMEGTETEVQRSLGQGFFRQMKLISAGECHMSLQRTSTLLKKNPCCAQGTLFDQIPVHNLSAGRPVTCEEASGECDSVPRLHTPRASGEVTDPPTSGREDPDPSTPGREGPDPSTPGREDRDPFEFPDWHTPPRVWANVLRQGFSPLAS